MKKYNIAVVGATGLVGSTFLDVLGEYKLPINELRLLASAKSAGKLLKYQDREIAVCELKEDSFTGIDIALFSAGSSISQIYAPIASKAGAVVIDNSSCFRNCDDIPLVVPEVNSGDIRNYGIIANPNCSTTQAVIPLKALDDVYGLKRVVYTTYQAVSGSGMKGKNDLSDTLAGKENSFYPYKISETCIPEIDTFLDNGYTKEEMKMVNETRKMLHRPLLPIAATCVRVPVANSHAVLIQAELMKDFDLNDVRNIFKNYPGLVLLDDPQNHIYPVSTVASGNDMVYVGRIRRDLSRENSILIYTVSDNIRKGAASNAVQIAKYIIDNKML